MKRVLLLLALVSPWGMAQERTETRELVGQLGNRSALLILHAAQRKDDSWQIAGEYLILPSMVRRYLEGERSPQLGLTSLKEGNSAILFGRPATGELRGTWRDGVFRGTRHAPGGQERERFEFSEEFASMDGYSAQLRCEAGEGRYSATLAYAVQAGQLQSLDWQSKLAPSGHSCKLSGLRQAPFKGGLRAESGGCRVTLREVGEFVTIAAEGCAQACGSEAYLEPMLIDRRGNCQLLRPVAR
jgi:hypothetical protein